MRTIKLNTAGGGVSGDSAGIGLSEVRTEIEKQSEFFLKRSYYIDSEVDYISEDNIDTSVYPRLKFIIRKPMWSSNAYLQFLPSQDGVVNTGNIYFSGTYYKNTTPSGLNNSSNPAYAGPATTMIQSANHCACTWIIDATFSQPTDSVQGISVYYDCMVQEVGGYQANSVTGNLLIKAQSGQGGAHYNGLALRPNTGQWSKGSASGQDNVEVEIYQSRRTAPTKLS